MPRRLTPAAERAGMGKEPVINKEFYSVLEVANEAQARPVPAPHAAPAASTFAGAKAALRERGLRRCGAPALAPVTAVSMTKPAIIPQPFVQTPLSAAAQADAQERLLSGVMLGSVVKLAVHARSGVLQHPVRLELRCGAARRAAPACR